MVAEGPRRASVIHWEISSIPLSSSNQTGESTPLTDKCLIWGAHVKTPFGIVCMYNDAILSRTGHFY